MSLLTDGLDQLKIPYDKTKEEQIEDFYHLLVEKNKVMNLTSIVDHDEYITKHILDSLLIFSVIPLKNQSVIDVGTGAGFPGIPLKIFFPDINITLIDSLNKRLLFIDDVIKKLSLKSINTIHGRAEELAHLKELRNIFDLGVSRAVANLSVLSELTLSFIKNNGTFIYYKSDDIETELFQAKNAIQTMGGSVASVQKLPIPLTDISRSLIAVQKTKITPDRFPRKPGTPNRKTL